MNRLSVLFISLVAVLGVAALVLVSPVSHAQSSAPGTAANDLSFHVLLSDATGIATTVTTAGTYYAVKGAAFSDAVNDGGGLLTWSETDGTLTVAAGGAGRYELMACIGDAIGANSATHSAAVFVGSTQKGNKVAETEGGTAARNQMGCSLAIVDLVASDVVTLKVTSSSDGQAVTIREASIAAKRIGL